MKESEGRKAKGPLIWRPFSVPTQRERLYGESGKRSISKIYAEFEKQVLFGIKRSFDHRDRKLEFPGGALNKGEDSLQALYRELQEEERQGILARSFAHALEGGRSMSSLTMEFKQGPLILYRLQLLQEEYHLLKQMHSTGKLSSMEAYGHVFLPEDEVNNVDLRKGVGDTSPWTPRTRKILKKIRLAQRGHGRQILNCDDDLIHL